VLETERSLFTVDLRGNILNNSLLFAKCLKKHRFFAFAFKVCKKFYHDPKKNFVKNDPLTETKQGFILRAFEWLGREGQVQSNPPA
jgi:hypothetical protein